MVVYDRFTAVCGQTRMKSTAHFACEFTLGEVGHWPADRVIGRDISGGFWSGNLAKQNGQVKRVIQRGKQKYLELE